MSNVKGKGQRLIPEELLKYLEAYKEAHPDPEAGGGATLDDIVDSQNHKRFIEGDGTPEEITGVTNVYCRWSLSGTHLMLVYAGTMTGTLESQDFCVFSVPQWILDKIYPMKSDGFIDKKNMPLYLLTADSSTSGDIYLYKTDEGLKIYLAISFNRSNVYGFRAQFDLLIDNDYSN